MSEELAWAHWWACPWEQAHSDWQTTPTLTLPKALARHHHARLSTLFQIEPCLPPLPTPALLQLAQADTAQRDLTLMLVNGVCYPSQEPRLDDEHNLWCQRLIKALSPNPISVNTDAPLHYLRAWVDPAVWQRLRLGFSRGRVLELEQHPRLLDNGSRMNTLWQAAIWRAISATNNDPERGPLRES